MFPSGGGLAYHRYITIPSIELPQAYFSFRQAGNIKPGHSRNQCIRCVRWYGRAVESASLASMAGSYLACAKSHCLTSTKAGGHFSRTVDLDHHLSLVPFEFFDKSRVYAFFGDDRLDMPQFHGDTSLRPDSLDQALYEL